MNVLFILYVKNQQKSCNFYKSLLLQEPVLNVPGMTEFQLSDNTKLGLMPEDGIAKILKDTVPHPSKGNGIPRCELYLTVNDPAEYYERAVKLGALPVSKLMLRDWGDEAAYCADPDGHIIAFARKVNVEP
jgi:uncharacterized glyoxalase superfamily protein PhnB